MANPVQIDHGPLSPPLIAPVERINDREALRKFLRTDALANAYPLCNLDPLYFSFGRWYGVRDARGEVKSALLIYQGLSIPVVFWAGNSGDVHTFLTQCRDVLPARFHFHVLDAHLPALQQTFLVSSATRMSRMGLAREHYAPAPHDARVERLGHRDTAAIMSLYAHYPDHFFEPYQLESGLYFGVRDEKLGLSAIAGVHFVNPEEDIAVIGNLVTHPDARNQGLAGLCTARLLNEVFERVSFVALNVQADNVPAVRVYERFGFQHNNVFYEGRCQD